MPERREDPMRLWVGDWVPESVDQRKDKPKQPKVRAKGTRAGSAAPAGARKKPTPELGKKIA